MSMEPAERVVRHFEEELEQLKSRLLFMGGLAEERLRLTLQAVTERDPRVTDQVLAGDEPVNQLHIEIDSRCFKLLALHQPMAVDLRAIVAAVKINTDLERVGDLAINIAEAVRRYMRHPPVKELIDIPRMAEISRAMFRRALDAYLNNDAEMARGVAGEDVKINQLNEQVLRELAVRREPLYREVADLVMATDGMTAAEAAASLGLQLAERWQMNGVRA